ncbi:hypothetical protein D3C79_1046470 [compost metagenome]
MQNVIDVRPMEHQATTAPFPSQGRLQPCVNSIQLGIQVLVVVRLQTLDTLDPTPLKGVAHASASRCSATTVCEYNSLTGSLPSA